MFPFVRGTVHPHIVDGQGVVYRLLLSSSQLLIFALNASAPAQTIDTTALLQHNLELKRLDAEAQLAETEVTQTSFLYRLIPSVSVTAHVGQHSILFVDPAHPWSIPSDALSAALTFDFDKILNPIPHQQAMLRAVMSRVQIDRTRSDILHQALATKKQIVLVDSLIAVLRSKLAFKEKLVELNELKYESNKSGFEDLARAKLDLSETQLEILTQMQKVEDLRARLSALGVQP